MKSYSFTIKFKDEIGYFSQSQVISDIKDLVIYNGFILGRNVKSVKKIKIKGDEANVSVSLLFDKNKKELEEAVNDIKNGLKKKKYKLIHQSFKKSNTNTKKKVSKGTTSKNKKLKNRNSTTLKNKKKKSSWFNLLLS
tara:strand:+ start:899 stop:1312 length:414 start_codon:yes stop_codon:yes gene_type:complete